MRRRRTYYRVCEKCGSNLDPNEKCNCARKKYDGALKTKENGQLMMVFPSDMAAARLRGMGGTT